MESEIVNKLISKYNNFVFVGEAGSGKTEVAISLAIHISKSGKKTHFIDMDQTKSLFRARDAEDILKQAGVIIHYQNQHLDEPIVVPGVNELLMDSDTYVVIDVGGGTHGTHMIGQFSHLLNSDKSQILYLFNPYRAWSRNISDSKATLSKVVRTARLNKVNLVANPNFGPNTTVKDVLEGVKKMRDLFHDVTVDFLCVKESLCLQIEGKVKEPVLPIKLSTVPEWM